MEIEQTTRRSASTTLPALGGIFRRAAWRLPHVRVHLGFAVFRTVFLAAALLLYASSAVPAAEARRQSFAVAVAGWSFDLITYEVSALSAKVTAALGQPARNVTDAEGTELVRAYLARAWRIGALERELEWRAGHAEPYIPPRPLPGEPRTIAELETHEIEGQLVVLRRQQDLVRPAVEQVIERQVSAALLQAGFGFAGRIWPPVQFTFTEPPKNLVVSARDRIATIYSRMLVTGLSLEEIEQAERAISAQHNAVAYITNVGGLGAYPAMVIDRAGLRWVLSTVVHEWVHNYLSFFPLGFNYFVSPETRALNETVADIVGNEIGDLIYTQVYGGEIPQPVPRDESAQEADDEEVFDFRREMRATRLEVDRLLELGEVEAAEAYMEARRQEFIANGYNLRVLNQAYFAFHGSYGTSPASSSPIGPGMERLRELSPDLLTFMQTVRGFTTLADLEQALAAHGEVLDR